MKRSDLILGLSAIPVLFVSLARAQVVEVPFEFYKNEVIVEVTINGHGPLNMMLDTGTDPSAIDLATAAAIGIEHSKKGAQGSGGGTDKNLTYECKFTTLELGSLSAKNIGAAAIDLSKVSEKMGHHIDGVLGYSLLKGRIVQFDYPAGVVRFFDKMPASRSTSAVTMKFRYKDNVLIDVMINGKPAVANLDTGSSGSFALSPKGTERLGLTDEAAKGIVKTSVGYNGKFENHAGVIGNIKIGSISIDSGPAIYFSKGTGHDDAPWDVNIGNVFFKDYVVTFDYQTKKVRFEKP